MRLGADLTRFLSADPIGYADHLNLYAYVGNDPVNKIDPNGNDGIIIDKAKNKAKSKAKDLAQEQLEKQGMNPAQACQATHCATAGVRVSQCLMQHCSEELGLSDSKSEEERKSDGNDKEKEKITLDKVLDRKNMDERIEKLRKEREQEEREKKEPQPNDDPVFVPIP